MELDSEPNAREFMTSMKYQLFFLLSLGAVEITSAQAAPVARQGVTTDVSIVAPAATQASVQKAVQILANNILKGNFGYAIDNMYPRYKKKQEKLLGEIIDAKEIAARKPPADRRISKFEGNAYIYIIIS